MINCAEYIWRATNRKGLKQQGRMCAGSLSSVRSELESKGFQDIHCKAHRSFFSYGMRVSSKDVTHFYQQMAIMLSAGLPILQALLLLSKELKSARLRIICHQVRQKLSEGIAFSSALSEYGRHFDLLSCTLIKAGENSGKLTLILKQLAAQRLQTSRMRQKFKKALMYPVSVLIIAMAVVILLLIFVVPTFEAMFQDFNAPLPWMTQVILEASEFLKIYGFMLGVILLGVSFGFYQLYRRWYFWRFRWDAFQLKIPMLGPCLQGIIMARFANILAIMLDSGVSLLEALEIVRPILKNAVYYQASYAIEKDILNGVAFKEALAATHLFAPFFIQMVAIGEASGRLADMFEQVFHVYACEVDDCVTQFQTLMEPIIMVFLGLIIGIIMLSMYLPMFEIGSIL